MFKDIIIKIKEFIFEKNYELDNIEKDIRKHKNNTSVLNKDINLNMSLYKLSLLTYKSKILENKNNQLKKDYINIKKSSANKIIIIRTIKHIILLLLIINSILMTGPISLIYLLITISLNIIYTFSTVFTYYNIYKYKNINEYLNILEESYEIIIESKSKIKDIINTLENNNKNNNTKDIDTIINHLIMYYINDKYKKIELPLEIKDYVINFLQNELNTKEEELNKLFDIMYNNYNNVKEEYNKTLKLVP